MTWLRLFHAVGLTNLSDAQVAEFEAGHHETASRRLAACGWGLTALIAVLAALAVARAWSGGSFSSGSPRPDAIAAAVAGFVCGGLVMWLNRSHDDLLRIVPAERASRDDDRITEVERILRELHAEESRRGVEMRQMFDELRREVRSVREHA